ncbi:MAG: hypothetical protein DCC43_00880 [Candidatus Brocadia sp.]|jgi:Glycosyltransferases involved in cell wall biogenesis|nr:glycosyltransferase [Candidatus Brocadia sp. AMX3]MDG5997063.1 glycosyltransferase [Candidatus Brocadia sp.]RIK03273.1 MAG: hypothetical protein DCC43_00880 [Candidatus Brocadia sp.]
MQRIYMKVSIITPTYNRGNLIAHTLESVLNQSYHNIEHIVIDGSSTDNTVDVLERYKKKYHMTYLSRIDKGMYYAINDGISMATGDIIAYLNSDDLYFPWTVQKAVETFQSNRDLDMIYGDSMVWDFITNKIYLNIYAPHRRYWLPMGGVLCQPTVFLRRRVFDRVGYFNTEFKYLADCEFWNRINNHADLLISKVDEVMAIECNHGDTLRETMKNELSKDKNKIAFLYRKKHNNSGLTGWLKLVIYVQREVKIWEFVLRCYLKTNSKRMRWYNFLETYNVRFFFFNYIFCKLFHDRARFSRFSIEEKEKGSAGLCMDKFQNVIRPQPNPP